MGTGLIKARADVNAKNPYGETLLDFMKDGSLKNQDRDIVEALFDAAVKAKVPASTSMLTVLTGALMTGL